MSCSKCGFTAPAGAVFCPKCGSPIAATCSRCGSVLPEDARFCGNCGCELQSDAPASAQPGVVQASATQTDVIQMGVPVIRQASQTGTSVEYAGFWRRFIASVADALVLWVPIKMIEAAFGKEGAASTFSFTLVWWLFNALMESSAIQGTPGKWLMGVAVVDMSGQRVSFAKASGRHFGKYISILICGIGFLMAGLSAKKQALHDMMAGCLVVRKKAHGE